MSSNSRLFSVADAHLCAVRSLVDGHGVLNSTLCDACVLYGFEYKGQIMESAILNFRIASHVVDGKRGRYLKNRNSCRPIVAIVLFR